MFHLHFSALRGTFSFRYSITKNKSFGRFPYELQKEKLIADLKKFEHLFMENTNGTYSAIPSLKIYQDLQNTNIKLRKQINEMELIQQKGTLLDTEDDYSPFC